MQEAEEQDTCRICSAPAEENQPLFHPCKCSGTIRYIHQDCLTTWLAHSNKKSCDVCKHPYSFTKVYAPDMPSSLPFILVMRRLVQQLFFSFLFILRGVVVGTIWLAVLPWATVRTWRMYFFMGDSAAWWISNLTRPNFNETSPASSLAPSLIPESPPLTVFGRISAHPAWIQLSADIFMGQIIASMIVLTFVAIFLLREWISQNARPGVFEDEEVPPPDANRPQGQLVGQRIAHVPVDQQQLQEALARRQVETMRALDEMRARDGVHGHLVGDERIHGRTPLDRVPRRRGKKREGIDDALRTLRPGSRSSGRHLQGASNEQDVKEDTEEERKRKHSFSRRIFAARVAGARRRAALAATGQHTLPTPPSARGNSHFEFTFQPPQHQQAESGREDGPSTSKAQNLSSILPPVNYQPPIVTIPFTFDHLKQPSPTPSPSASTPALVPTGGASKSLSAGHGPSWPMTISDPPLPLPPAYSEIDLSPPTPSPISPTALNAVLEPRPPSVYNMSLSDAEAGPSRLPSDELPTEVPEARKGKAKAETVEDDLEMEANMSDFFGSDSEHDWQPEDEVKEEDEGHEEPNAPESRPQSSSDEDEEDEAEDMDVDRDEQNHGTDDSDDSDEEAEDEPWRPIEVRAGGNANGIEQPPVNAGVPPPVVQNLQLVAQEGGLAGDQNELEGAVEDDMEGAMEAIGMRGPIHGVLQNAALMIFVLDTAIGVGIFIPFLIGKTTALLLLNPPRYIEIIHLPIKAIRIVTDPIVDGIAYALANFALPPVLLGCEYLKASLADSGLPFFSKAQVETPVPEAASNFVVAFTSRVADFATTSFQHILSWSSAATPQPQSDKMFESQALNDAWEKAEPYFAVFGQHVRLSFLKSKLTWIKISIGSGPAERTFAITLGYAVVGFALAIYLNLLTVGNAKSANRAIRSAVRQQLLVVKVAAFIFIELITFPLTCGIVLDLCTVCFFPDTPLNPRVGFFKQAPLTAIFYHWVAGTMFMYTFAVILAGCRSVMRVGAMWFIKDPQDQNSHPIRDILDRPTFTQLRKISVSGLMYGIVVTCFVSSMSILLSLGKMSILPFRWKNREPLSTIPIDLISLHLVLPYTMQYFRPKKPLRRYATLVWKWLASRLRLTSYFFGDRPADEEKATRWWRLLSLKSDASENDGSFRRVPATDNVSLPREMRATAEVDALGHPVNDAAAQLIQCQDAEVIKAKKRVGQEFTTVYIPPKFRWRVFVFITCLWILGIAFLGAAIAVPIQLGRSFFQVFTPRELHDGYSMIMGFYILWAGYLVVAWIDRLDNRRQSVGGTRRSAELPLLAIKRGLEWLAKVIILGTWLGIIIPTLIAIVVDLYVIIPIRISLEPDWVPTIRIVDTWALGLLYTKIGMHVMKMQRARNLRQGQDRPHQLPGRISEGIQRIIINGWTNPKPLQASYEVIMPVFFGLVGMIVLPGAVFMAVRYLLPNLKVDSRFIFMHVYPSIFTLAGVVRSAVLLEGKMASWSQSIRDKEFLVEMRLRNHEPEKERSNNSSEVSLRTDT